jgi:hypothetical protein
VYGGVDASDDEVAEAWETVLMESDVDAPPRVLHRETRKRRAQKRREDNNDGGGGCVDAEEGNLKLNDGDHDLSMDDASPEKITATPPRGSGLFMSHFSHCDTYYSSSERGNVKQVKRLVEWSHESVRDGRPYLIFHNTKDETIKRQDRGRDDSTL